MTNSIEENMFAELINLRNENQMLKEQLSQTNINSEAIHNNTTLTNEELIRRRQQLSNMFESINYEVDADDEICLEDMARGYEEMGNIMLQENLELSQNN